MPVYQLNEQIVFPPVDHAEPDGLLALGGDLSTPRLLQAYSDGIFPWFSEGDPILWWSPDPRMILLPEELRVSHSMKPLLKRNAFEVTFDKEFANVIQACSESPRKGQDGTWITNTMIDAYIRLHEEGYAHSVEVRSEGRLVGGLYGVSLGAAFFGESMFSRESNASKYGLIYLVRALQNKAFKLIDCQMPTPHLASLGCREVSRFEFCGMLSEALKSPTSKGSWTTLLV